MSVREIDSYSQYAVGAGCFFNNSPQQMVDDPDTGVKRRERVFTSDTMIEYEHEGTIEYGERFAMEISDALGWIPPKTWKVLKEHASQMELAATEANKRAVESEEASLVNVRQAAEAIIKADDLAKQVTSLTAALKAEKTAASNLKRKITTMEKHAKKAEGFGDR